MRIVSLLLLGALVCLPVFSQTAERLDQVLSEDKLTVGSAAYIAAASGGVVGDGASPPEALDALAELGFPADTVELDDVIRLDRFAYMLMLSYDRSGGIFYSLFPGPRYALRELRHERVIRDGGDPNDPLSGSRGLRLVGRMLSIVEAEG